MIIQKPSAILLHYTQNAEQEIELAGRVCYKSEASIKDGSHIAFIHMLMSGDSPHESVLEHASASFKVTCDRGIANELVRHRIASYSQESTRYCNYSKDKFGQQICVIKPSEIPLKEDNEEIYDLWENSCLISEDSYFALLEYGVRAQVARAVLPICLKTEIVMTANFREWLHFLRLRTAKSAHPDMRIVANIIAYNLVSIAPTVFQEFA